MQRPLARRLRFGRGAFILGSASDRRVRTGKEKGHGRFRLAALPVGRVGLPPVRLRMRHAPGQPARQKRDAPRGVGPPRRHRGAAGGPGPVRCRRHARPHAAAANRLPPGGYRRPRAVTQRLLADRGRLDGCGHGGLRPHLPTEAAGHGRTGRRCPARRPRGDGVRARRGARARAHGVALAARAVPHARPARRRRLAAAQPVLGLGVPAAVLLRQQPGRPAGDGAHLPRRAVRVRRHGARDPRSLARPGGASGAAGGCRPAGDPAGRVCRPAEQAGGRPRLSPRHAPPPHGARRACRRGCQRGARKLPRGPRRASARNGA